MLELTSYSAGARDYAQKFMEYRLGLRKAPPSERGSWYTMSPQGAAAVRQDVGILLREDEEE